MKENILIKKIFLNIQNINKCALISDYKEKITYGELFHIVTDLSSYLKKEQIALIVMNNDVGAVVFYLACLMVGTVPIIVDKKVTRLEINQYIKKYKPELVLILSQSDLMDMFDWNSDYTKMRNIYRHILYRSKVKVKKRISSLLAILLPTSGTIHVSKLVRVSKENIYDNAKNICKALQISTDDIAITSLPLSYTYGLSVLNTHLLKHATILLTDKSVLQKSFWQFSNHYKATSFAGVPYTYELLERNGHLNKENTIKVYTQAGGRLSIRLQKLFTEYCIQNAKKFYVMYGQTEATARISVLQMDYAIKKMGSVGRVINGGAVHIQKQNPFVDEGEIIYSGKNVCLGYCSNLEDISKDDENDGVLYTGDIGYIDEEGFIFITGRKSDFIKKYGRRICLSSIAKMIDEQYDIEVIVRYEEPVIVIIFEEKHKEKMKVLEETLYQYLHLKKTDILFQMTRQFERTYNGKVIMGGTNAKYI